MNRRLDFRQAARFWQAADRSPAWVALGWFWVAVLGSLTVGAAVLEVLGPPPLPVPPEPAALPVAAADLPKPAPREPAVPLRRLAVPVPAADNGLPGPDAALLELAGTGDGMMLPRIGADGRMPMRIYAARFDATDSRPRVAVLLTGIGMAEIDSQEAIRATPAAVSLAFSPYAARPAGLLEAARAAGHEVLVSIPMEPVRYPLNDAGPHSLLTGLSLAENHERLDWALSRIAGYVGATAAMSGLRGERFGSSRQQMSAVLDELGGRGLLYVDPRPVPVRPGDPSLARPGVRVVDVVIDEPPARADIEAKLARLEQAARDRGSALGVAGLPTAVTIERLAAWTMTLGSRGVALVPVSALVPPPVFAPLPVTPETSPSR